MQTNELEFKKFRVVEINQNPAGQLDNPNVDVRYKEGFGNGLFAKEDLKPAEIVASFDGDVYEAENALDLPPDIADHAIQIADNRWVDSRGISRIINHSCDPNCGISEDRILVTLRAIKAGEELTYDYDTTEDSDWRMECKCGDENCRHTIGSYALLSSDIRKKYAAHTATYLLEKYGRPE